MKKMLFWGHIGNVHHAMEDMHHLSPARSQAQAKIFSNIYDVTMAVFHKSAEKIISPTLKMVHIFDLKPDHDIFFLNFRLAINQLYNYSNSLEVRHKRIFENREHIFKNLLEHPNMAIQLDAPRSFVTDNDLHAETKLVQNMKHIGISTEQGIINWEKMRKTKTHFLSHAATISYRPHKTEDPMPNNNRKRVLYLGRLNDPARMSTIDKLELLAKQLPHIDFIVISCKIKDKTGKIITPMLTDPNEITVKKTEEAKQQFSQPNIIFMPGPRYTDTFNYMYHADLALGFAAKDEQDACSCKVIEYLGSGCPVILEEGVPESWMLDEINCGKIANINNMAEQVELALQENYNRDAIKTHFLANHTYEQRLKKWQEKFDDIAV